MKIAIWINFDLGVRGYYDGLYTWLDGKGDMSTAVIDHDVRMEVIYGRQR
jgi:hypothetical protein